MNWRYRDGGSSGSGGFGSPNPHRLYRNPAEGLVAGVCAGIADYTGLMPWQVRGLTLLGLMIFPPPTFIAYVVMAIVLRRRPRAPLYRSPEEERFWQSVSLRPGATFQNLRHRFRELEQRLADMEGTVTSPEFKLDREIRNLDR